MRQGKLFILVMEQVIGCCKYANVHKAANDSITLSTDSKQFFPTQATKQLSLHSNI